MFQKQNITSVLQSNTSARYGNIFHINNLYAKLYVPVPEVVKTMNVKVSNLISRTNETRYIKQRETCKCKCRLDVSICNNEQIWNEDKCRCESNELIDKGIGDKGFNWNLDKM